MSSGGMGKMVLATGNAGKIREIAPLFHALGIELVLQSELGIESPPETGTSFVENALIKARHACRVAGLPAVADDSGLCVDALQGLPGVRSARYAGEDASDDQNLDKLLSAMRDVPGDFRGAGFHCAAVVVFDTGKTEPLIAEGVWRGTLLRQRRGEGGFGYDPVFLDPGTQHTCAEMSRDEKNLLSHRGNAFRQLCERLQALLK